MDETPAEIKNENSLVNESQDQNIKKRPRLVENLDDSTQEKRQRKDDPKNVSTQTLDNQGPSGVVDSLVNKKNEEEEEEGKNITNHLVHVFTTGLDNKVNEWEIDLKENESKLVKTFEHKFHFTSAPNNAPKDEDASTPKIYGTIFDKCNSHLFVLSSSGDNDGFAVQWNTVTNETKKLVATEEIPECMVKWESKTGDKLIVGYLYNGNITISPINPFDSFNVITLKGHKNCINNILLDEKNEKLLSCSSDETIKLWSLSDNTLLKTFTGHTGAVSSICFLDKEKNFFASGSQDNSIKIWSKDKCIHTIEEAHTFWIQQLAVSIKKQLLISFCGSLHVVKVWRLKFDDFQQSRLEFEISNPFNERVVSMQILDKKETLVMFGDSKGNYFIFDLNSKSIVMQRRNAHAENIVSIVLE